jgi:zinc protease
MKPARLTLALLLASTAAAQFRVVQFPSKSPLVTFRIVFTTGAAADPADKPGLAALTANLIADSGTRDLTYKQVEDALFPMAASLDVQVDKEMTAFTGSTHVDNLAAYYKLLRARLLDPGWREEDFTRVRDDLVDSIRSGLRNNDEELGKEVLFENIFQATPYATYNGGTVSSLEKLTLADVKQFYAMHYSQSNLYLGIAGGFSPAFLEAMKKDFRHLPTGGSFRPRPKLATLVEGNRAVIVEKDTRSVAFSLGFPLVLTRSASDYAALLVAASYLGQHRMSGGVLYQEMRERRGLNYGDYAYIEYFPLGMYRMEPPPNVARRQQIFQLWIRPVEPSNAVFALRLALYELNQLIKDGIPQDGFERTREFVGKHINVLTRTRGAELGYAIDSIWYGAPNLVEYLKGALAKLTRDDVNRVIRQHLRTNRLVIVAVSNNAEDLKRQLASGDPSPMTYNSPKPASVTDVDKIVEKLPLHLRPEDIRIVPASKVFE